MCPAYLHPVHLQAEAGEGLHNNGGITGVFSENPPVEFTLRTVAPGMQLQGSPERRAGPRTQPARQADGVIHHDSDASTERTGEAQRATQDALTLSSPRRSVLQGSAEPPIRYRRAEFGLRTSEGDRPLALF